MDHRCAPSKIAVVGSGISGMSAAWLASGVHDVTLYEAATRLGGHSHTVEAPTPRGPVPVDMGFIVYNEANYPNLEALFAHLGVPTQPSDMGFAVSLDNGALEYGGNDFSTLFAQWRNLVRPRFWSMLSDLARFYREAPLHACALDAKMTSLGDYLTAEGYGRAFQNDHLLPQAAAIWSASVRDIRTYPAAAFIRFCDNHGLLELKIRDRPLWRTVRGGSRTYVERLTAAFADKVRRGRMVTSIARTPAGVIVRDCRGGVERFDEVVVATHADEALRLVESPAARERALLGAFAYSRNHAVLHCDASLMPRRRRTWSAWNYVGGSGPGSQAAPSITYWMNRLQGLPEDAPLFVSLNPQRAPDPAKVIRTEIYGHPIFDAAAMQAQRQLWSLQGEGGLWWCGAYFGAGFHEDGLQAGLAVAEALGSGRRPWSTPNESGRIHLGRPAARSPRLERVA